jgi:hypothetical protein
MVNRQVYMFRQRRQLSYKLCQHSYHFVYQLIDTSNKT